ncbi:FAD:protein FMN transferase [Candidatus Methylomirabilis sp.]|uniref:FAD:protein FMN transferase n=1 Tax=Candidatus Methylomirabilis sp. TaxID=2032687 RepID=UPI002A5BE687|nr:FAD:protein FMN transferase [Candidatus Methylomirabilis sp.]
MGTLLEITLYHQSPQKGKRVLARCFQEARRLEDIFSAYDDDSDLNRLNRYADLGPVEINQELRSVIEISLRLGSETEEVMDITVGPLNNLWKAAEEEGTTPSPASVADALSRTGIAKVQFLPDGRVELGRSGMRLELGGIGKGYAVDLLTAILVQEGVTSAFINFGRSSLAAVGSPPERESWPVLLGSDDGTPIGLAHLKDQHLSISSSFGRSFEIEGTRLGHLIDPRNGFPVRNRILGVAVARTATEAEALTKALVILGPTRGFVVVKRFSKAEGLLIYSNGSQVSSSGFIETVQLETTAAILREGIS